MTQIQYYIAILAGGLCLIGLVLPFGFSGEAAVTAWSFPWLGAFLVLSVLALAIFRESIHPGVVGVLAIAGGAVLLAGLNRIDQAAAGFWITLLAAWALAWLFAERLSQYRREKRIERDLADLLIPLMFGAAVLVLWEAGARGGQVPFVILPPPSAIWARIVANVPVLLADFQQTFLKSVLAGYALGCGLGFLVAIAIDRSPFLKQGLLPLGNFVSALPMVGVAPIMVMWFGFDWPSKAAVVVIMTFFPMLVNTVAGLNASGQMERDMMRTYAANYWQTLLKLRLPAAAPFIFNALKINSTLALIGAIVAEFFGTPVVGMGFRISTEVGRLNVDMVWAEIAVAAIAGSAFYGVVALVERAVTFWHPSVRGGRT
ncbi:MAG TPA: ABC transporter permease [Devosiaceae bacterium]|jgi:NitT/TauT family transport system permease protein|nr:ABC transporter permease [Devosiaceae bacterium]